MTAGGVEPWHPNAIALFDNGDARSNSRNQTDGFVAGNKRKRRLQRPISVSRVEIGVANPACLRLDNDLANSGSRDVPLPKHKWLSELLNHCRIHLSWCH